jgi:hypothetical protein
MNSDCRFDLEQRYIVPKKPGHKQPGRENPATLKKIVEALRVQVPYFRTLHEQLFVTVSCLKRGAGELKESMGCKI